MTLIINLTNRKLSYQKIINTLKRRIVYKNNKNTIPLTAFKLSNALLLLSVKRFKVFICYGNDQFAASFDVTLALTPRLTHVLNN